MKIGKTVLTVSLCFGLTLPAYAGQLQSGTEGVRYIEDDGSIKIGWHQETNGDWYFFDFDSGYAKQGLFTYDGKTYYFAPNGVMATNRKMLIENTIWEFDENGYGTELGSNYSGWLHDDKGWWFRFPDGSWVSNNWYQDNEQWYYFDPEGYMVTGLREVDGKQYYFDEANGNMLSNTTVTLPNGTSYTLTEDGSIAWPYKPITVIPPENEKSDEFHQLDAMCDQILASITSPTMSNREKANHIYNWIKGHMAYVNRESGTDWVHEAIRGIRSGRGDCFTYFAMSQALLTRCGMQCIQVIRSTDNNHYWILVHVEDGWFHFDTTPRNGVSQRVCLLTDRQLASLPKASAWIFDHSLYPRTP